jgi:arylsulfatase A-like enzyme
MARLWALQHGDHETLTLGGYRQKAIQAYLASVSFADEQVGRILTALDASQHRANTLIALWSDNGFHLGEKLHWRKFTLWEQATRVPLIVVDPRHPNAVAEVHQPVSLIDLFPTLLGMAGVTQMTGVDGESLIASDRKGVPVATRPVVMSWGQGNDSIRWGQWRYTRYADGGEELYNLLKDPWEHDNLADFDAFQGQREELKELLQRVLIRDRRRHHG